MGKYLSDADYKLVTSSVPITCVDMMAVRRGKSGAYELGVIERATGSQARKLALIGGRVDYEEEVADALARHLKTDLGLEPEDWQLLAFDMPINLIERPFYLQQYRPGTQSEPPRGFDPTKHSIALNYLISLNTEPKPANEATSFHWITEQQAQVPAAFNQHFVFQEAFRFLSQMMR